MNSNSLILCLSLMAFTVNLGAQTLDIRISNIRSEKGKIQLSLYSDQRSFDTDRPLMTNSYSKSSLTEGSIHLVIELKKGIYGIALLDDENGNGEMDYSTLGIPREGFGFSNYDKQIRKRPDFSDFQFEVGDNIQFVEIKVNYR